MHRLGRIWTLLLGALIATSLVGCGGDTAVEKSTVTSVTVRAGVSTLLADGQNATTIRATVKDANGKPVAGVTVDFSTTHGNLKLVSAQTDDNGVAETIISGNSIGNAEVSADVSGVGNSVKIDFITPKVQAAATAKLAIGASKPSIATNNADSTTITVTVLDSRNAVIPNILVDFSATGGQLSKPGAITDENGAAKITLSSAVGDPTNQIIMVTATVGTVLTKTIPIQVDGSTLTVETSNNTLLTDGSSASKSTSVTVSAKDAANSPVFGADITLTVESANGSQGTGVLSVLSGKTDIAGHVALSFTAGAEGSVIITAQGIGAKGTKGITIAKTQQSFRFTTPATKSSVVNLNSKQTYQVAAPTQSEVTFFTSIGTLKLAGASDCAGGTSTLKVPVVSGTATASVVFCPTTGGTATIDVIDSANANTKEQITVLVAAPSGTASTLVLQSNVTVVAVSTGELSRQAELVATVTNASGIPVLDQPVWLKLENATGGGEFLSSSFGLTDARGQLRVKFTSGSISTFPRNPADSSLGGVVIKASTADGATSSTLSDSVSIIIGGVAGSLTLGTSTSLESSSNDTTYKVAVSVLVTDANGSAAPGATVSVSTWPASFRRGHWTEVYDTSGNLTNCTLTAGAWLTNPDVNGNLVLDGAEVAANKDQYDDIIYDLSAGTVFRPKNGVVDADEIGPYAPTMAAAGSVPQTVVTDANGVATFDLIYVKSQAAWIMDNIVASTQVFGSISSSTFSVLLPALTSDIKACVLPDSPYGDVPVTVP